MRRRIDTSTPALRTEGLTRRFGSHTVVDNVSLSVAEGEVFGLLGRNGAGKSTFIKMLTTLLPPTAGSALVEGFDILRQPARVREVIGYVPQALSADGELTGYENLLVFAQLYDIPRALRQQRIGEALDFMGLKAAASKLVATYSGGMIRRLEIAQSMLHRPKLLFLDEPTVGLDPVARETVWAHLRPLRANLATHHPHDHALHGGGSDVLLPRGHIARRPTGGLRQLRRVAGDEPRQHHHPRRAVRLLHR